MSHFFLLSSELKPMLHKNYLLISIIVFFCSYRLPFRVKSAYCISIRLGWFLEWMTGENGALNDNPVRVHVEKGSGTQQLLLPALFLVI